MARTARHTNNCLAFLQSNAKTLDFYQAMRMIKRWCPQGYQIEIKSLAALYFAVSDIAKITVDTCQQKLTLWQTFIGLTGQNGVLPLHFTTQLLVRLNAKDKALADFLRYFDQRIAELMYDVWRSSRFDVDFEQGHCHTNPCLSLLRNLIQPIQPQASQSTLDWQFFYAGFLINRVKTREGLQRILQGYFDLPVIIRQYHGQWIRLNDQQLTSLSVMTDAKNNRIGQSCLLGQRVWLTQNHFQLIFGPLSYPQYCQLLPNGSLLAAIRKVVTTYVGYEYRCTLTLSLSTTALPQCCLRHEQPCELGWRTWIGMFKQRVSMVSVTFGQWN